GGIRGRPPASDDRNRIAGDSRGAGSTDRVTCQSENLFEGSRIGLLRNGRACSSEGRRGASGRSNQPCGPRDRGWARREDDGPTSSVPAFAPFLTGSRAETPS